MGPRELAAGQKAFEDLDEDKCGALSPDQVFGALGAISPGASRAFVDELISEFDENGDGQIQLDEFLVMMGKLLGAGKPSASGRSVGQPGE